MQNANYNAWNMNSFEFQEMNRNNEVKNAINNKEKFNVNDSQFNGRLFFTPQDNTKSYDLFEDQNKDKISINNLFTKQEKTSLSCSFYSKENLDKLQNKIIEGVFVESNGEFKIGRQSDLQLQIIMRSIYLTYGRNKSTHIEEQVAELNNKVISEALKSILPNIKQFLHYKKEISEPRPIRPNSVNVSSKGNNQLGNPLFN